MPRVKNNNRLGTQKTISFNFDEELAREGRQGYFKNSFGMKYFDFDIDIDQLLNDYNSGFPI